MQKSIEETILSSNRFKNFLEEVKAWASSYQDKYILLSEVADVTFYSDHKNIEISYKLLSSTAIVKWSVFLDYYFSKSGELVLVDSCFTERFNDITLTRPRINCLVL